MNHLAHLMLARNSDELMLGGFIADAVKGKKFLDYEKEISKGILLHRFIDNFTDTHTEVSELKKLLRPQFGLLSGVVIDMIYDHILAKHWNEFNTDSLESFSHSAYRVFEKDVSIMPERNQHMLTYMRKENWLLNYATIAGMTKSFNGMARRIRKGELLLQAPQFILDHEIILKESFFRFYPLLIKACEEEKIRLKSL
ncbi:MAG: ACP phosphodiesterase [Bacteroidota bacterium]